MNGGGSWTCRHVHVCALRSVKSSAVAQSPKHLFCCCDPRPWQTDKEPLEHQSPAPGHRVVQLEIPELCTLIGWQQENNTSIFKCMFTNEQRRRMGCFPGLKNLRLHHTTEEKKTSEFFFFYWLKWNKRCNNEISMTKLTWGTASDADLFHKYIRFLFQACGRV